MATIETLNYISKQLNIYCGLFMLVIGIIGGLGNILVFRHYSFHTSSCCIFMFVRSITSLVYISFSLSDRIIDQGFEIHWTASNIPWCKIWSYLTHCTSLIAIYCLVFSVIDRFLSTCRQIKWRHLNSVYTAKHICLFLTIFWLGLAFPTLIYATPTSMNSNQKVCQSSSVVWSHIRVYFFDLFCLGIFPWFLVSLFGCLTYRNMRHLRHHRVGAMPSSLTLSRTARLDHQLTSILFLQIIICLIASLPFLVLIIYDNVTGTIVKSNYREAQENLFLQIAYLTYYWNYISTFYVNYYSSTIFRQVSKQVARNFWKKKEDISRDITMINHQENQHALRR